MTFSFPTLYFSGYICQEIDAEVLTEQSNPILTAIIHGMRSSEPSNHVRLAATQALLNSLEFTKANFDKENERNFIMEVVCEATQSTDMRISVAALQCLVGINFNENHTIYQSNQYLNAFFIFKIGQNPVSLLSIHGTIHGASPVSYNT